MLTIALWGLIELAADAEAAGGRGDGPVRPYPRGWILWAGGTAAALLLMSVAVPWLAASAAAFAVIRTRTPPARRRAFDRALLAAVLPVLALWLPWLPALAGSTAGQVAHFWASPLSPASLASGIWAVYLFGVIDPLGFVGTGFLPVHHLERRQRHQDRRHQARGRPEGRPAGEDGGEDDSTPKTRDGILSASSLSPKTEMTPPSRRK